LFIITLGDAAGTGGGGRTLGIVGVRGDFCCCCCCKCHDCHRLVQSSTVASVIQEIKDEYEVLKVVLVDDSFVATEFKEHHDDGEE
jgi:hypothetical protein